jgi:hypothetical protein
MAGEAAIAVLLGFVIAGSSFLMDMANGSESLHSSGSRPPGERNFEPY